MTQREKILAAVVLAVLLLLGSKGLWGRYRDLVDQRQQELHTAQQQLADANVGLRRGQRALERLAAWQRQSLPADRESARSLYRTWLVERCEQAGLAVDDVQPSQRSISTAAQTAIGYTLIARGTVKSTITLLYEFYRSTMLHQITRLQIRPAGDASQLSVTLTVEALILPGATHAEQLPTGVSDRLAKASVEEYIESIVGRNLVAVYRPPRPDPPPRTAGQERPPPQFDAAKHAYVTGIVQVNGRLQAWITVRTTGEVLRLFEGDALKVGLLDGHIVSIAPRMIVLECDDKQLQVSLGENLRDGKAIGEPGEPS
jgi:hypothetical protein